MNFSATPPDLKIQFDDPTTRNMVGDKTASCDNKIAAFARL